MVFWLYSRHCKSINGVLSGDRASPLCSAGTSYEEMPCDGWGPWTTWSECDLATDSRTRSRQCLNNRCDSDGHDFERQSCDGLPSPVASTSQDLIAVACICCFIVGAGFGAGIVIYFIKYRRPGGNGGDRREKDCHLCGGRHVFREAPTRHPNAETPEETEATPETEVEARAKKGEGMGDRAP